MTAPSPSAHPQLALEVSCENINSVFAPGSPVLVGRSVDSAVTIADPGVSGRHLLVESNGAGWIARDLSTTNGTFCGGVRFTVGAITTAWQTLELGGLGQGTLLHLRAVEVAAGPRPGLRSTPPDSDAAPPPPAPTMLHRSVAPGSFPSGEIGSETRAWTSRRQLRDVPVRRSVLVGRDPSCDVVIHDLLVSRQHARLEFLDDGTARIVDLGSINGTFVDQRLAAPAIELVEGSLVSVGNAELEFVADGLRPRRTTGAGFAVFGLTVPGRLDHVSFALPARSFLAVLGTSGAGKSTLLKAITGIEPAKSGSVQFDGRDLYANFRALRHRIGYVPQDDILHDQLTVDQSLGFGAELRFPDASPSDRKIRIDEVLRDLGLESHRSKLVRQLSGGQRKRVSVGLELLHRPALLILDEPTSGLDPGNERRLMAQLARLAKSDGGRTILVVTHSTESLHLCDQVLFLATGGVTIYMGPPDQAPAALGAVDFPDAFAAADGTASPQALRTRFLATPLGAPIRALQVTIRAAPRVPGRPPLTTNGLTAKSTFGRDVRIFTRRYVRLLMSDRRTLLTLALQAPVIAGMIFVAASSNTLDRVAPVPGAGNVLMALVLGSIYAGASNAAREVVKERAILRREQNFGISLAAYLISKIVVLAAVVAVQAIVSSWSARHARASWVLAPCSEMAGSNCFWWSCSAA